MTTSGRRRLILSCVHGSSSVAAASLPRPFLSRSCKGTCDEGNRLPSWPPGREPRALRAAGARRQPPAVRRPGRGHARRGGVRRGAGARRARQRNDGRLRGQLALARAFRGCHGARLAPARRGRRTRCLSCGGGGAPRGDRALGRRRASVRAPRPPALRRARRAGGGLGGCGRLHGGLGRRPARRLPARGRRRRHARPRRRPHPDVARGGGRRGELRGRRRARARARRCRRAPAPETSRRSPASSRRRPSSRSS